MKKTIIIIVLVASLIIFFFPKSNGEGGSCVGCKNIECKCFGFQKNRMAVGAWRSICYGIPYNCKTYIIKPY